MVVGGVVVVIVCNKGNISYFNTKMYHAFRYPMAVSIQAVHNYSSLGRAVPQLFLLKRAVFSKTVLLARNG